MYVFGSFASDEATKESDLDIALLLDKPAVPVQLWDLAQTIARKIQRDVDLIDLLSATTVLRFQIITTAKRIDTRDFDSCDEFEDRAYTSYIRFNETRAEILKDIEKRGSIYPLHLKMRISAPIGSIHSKGVPAGPALSDPHKINHNDVSRFVLQ